MKLYGNTRSICSRKVFMTLNEKQKEVQFTPIDLAKGEQKSADYLKLHPFGVVPVLEDGDFRMYESRAIIRYLDEKFPENKLVPHGLQDRATMEQWISMEYSYFSPGAFKIFFNKVLAPMRGVQVDQSAIKKGREEVDKFFAVMNKHLMSKNYLAGETFSLADIVYMPLTDYLHQIGDGDLISSYPQVQAWWNRVSSRPTWKKVTG